jgi:hypothetical protein
MCTVKKTSLRWMLPRLGLVLIGSLLGLLMAEGLARMIAPAGHADLLFNSPDSSPQGLYVNDPDLLLIPAPGFKATVQSLDYEVPLRINALSLRGPDLIETDSNWLAVGDSFTMAVQVSEDDTFSGQLSATSDATFLNAGVDGYSTWQSLKRYERMIAEGVELEGVLLTFFLGNDFQDNTHFEALSRQASQLEPGSPIPRAELPWLEGLLLRNSVLYAHYRVWRKARDIESGDDHDRGRWQQELSIFTPGGQANLNHLSGKTKEALLALKRATDAQGDALLVTIAPPAFVVDSSRLEPTFEIVGLDPSTALIDAPGELADRILSELSIPSCDLTGALRDAHASGQELYFRYDGHWTVDGHTVVADTIRACMESLP